MAISAGARLQLHLRDVALETQWMVAQLVPFAPILPDLTPLLASPVPGVESSGFGWRRDPMNKRARFHRGTDFRADRGTPVYAAGPGMVAFTGRQRGYGKVIYIDHGGGLVTRYAHLNRIEIEAGTPILAGLRIGQVGSTGRTTGPHLHFEVRIEGRAVDPSLAMKVAELQRTDPVAARLVALELDPERQHQKVDRHDPARPRAMEGKRPERRGAPTRTRALW
ncbi:MAG: M23 family metallopeptidase [Deltaproteobacteria bacterium]|nr:M23 family metallopeptidase [Kofleriaceae bacterium]